MSFTEEMLAGIDVAWDAVDVVQQGTIDDLLREACAQAPVPQESQCQNCENAVTAGVERTRYLRTTLDNVKTMRKAIDAERGHSVHYRTAWKQLEFNLCQALVESAQDTCPVCHFE